MRPLPSHSTTRNPFLSTAIRSLEWGERLCGFTRTMRRTHRQAVVSVGAACCYP